MSICPTMCSNQERHWRKVFQTIQAHFKSSDDDTNFVNENQEPFVVKQGLGVNSSQSPPQSNHNCCYKCGDSLDDIFCQRCTCKSCGNGAHIGYNCPPKVSTISNPEQCNQTINELPQTLPSVHPTCNSGDENSFTYDSKPNSVNDLLTFSTSYEEESDYTKDKAAKDQYWKIPICYDDDEDYTIAITPILSTEEPVDSLIIEDEHLDTIPATKSDEVIKSSVENLVQILSESNGIPDSGCDVPLCDNPTPLEAFKEHSETIIDSNNDSTSSNDDHPYSEDIDYVDASPPDAEIVSLEVVESVIHEVGGVDTDILLTIKDDILREKLLNVNLLIANIEALKDNPVPSSDFVIKSPSTFPNSFLEETNTFDNSLTKSKTFRFNLSDFYHEEFADELAHIISPPDLECFYFKIEPDPGDLIDPGIRENVSSTTNVNLPFEDAQSPLLAFVVWIFLAFLTYPVTPPYLLSCGNEDTIFDPGIPILCQVHLVGMELLCALMFIQTLMKARLRFSFPFASPWTT
ncbi:hypothetical protein Tco_1485177 [Tanacetum coccineum]